jgi:class 3 adenylate cyclase
MSLPEMEHIGKMSVRARRNGSKLPESAVMRSIRRGSQEWDTMLRPFVSSLVFLCIRKRRAQSDPSFFPWKGHCAVLFVDLSGYSKVTTAMAHRGAFALSTVVNAYLERLLMIVHEYGGDVVKFAGDAILVAWEGDKDDLDLNVLCAAQCAKQMQKRAGSHSVEGTTLEFNIHIGLSCGQLETEIFESPTRVSMQRLYHVVGGEPLIEMAELVELAQSGEVCISEQCHHTLKLFGTFRRCGTYTSAQILTSLQVDSANEERIEAQADKLMRDREVVRNAVVQEDFVHPSVLKFLIHSGNSPTQIAQMRNLCVLFICMTSNGSPVNWLMEVQGVLDKHRCPIVQIIDDDKGVHVVAAINLYESVPDTTTLALNAALELLHQQVGCAIGMAMGSTFCGVTGCSKIACRWDITGFPVVRAARLMQWARSENITVAIDNTVYKNTVASNRMNIVNSGIYLKGTSEAIPVFTLSQSKNFTASMIMEHTALAPIHNNVTNQVFEILSGSKPRGVVIVSGPPLAGKKTLCQRAAGRASLVPILHICDSGGGHLQLARTIVMWYQHCKDPEIREVSGIVEEHMKNHRWSRAHEECVRLFNIVMVAGYHGCFIVDRCQFLDDFSLSLMRDCVGGSIRTLAPRGDMNDSIGSSIAEGTVEGKLFFLCILVPLYHWRTDHCFEYELRQTRDINISRFKIAEVSMTDLQSALKYIFDLDATPSWFSMYAEQTGYNAGYFLNRIEAIILLSVRLSKEGMSAYSMINLNLNFFIPPDMMVSHRKLTIMQINPEIGMRFTQGFDELPPKYQTFMKVLGVLPTKTFHFACPFPIISEIMDDIFDDGVDSEWLETALEELSDLYMIKVHQDGNMRRISLFNPALIDVVTDVCTPTQLHFICTAILGRLESHLKDSFEIPLVCAAICAHLKDHEQQNRLWIQGYEQLLNESAEWTEIKRNAHKLILQQEIEDGICCPKNLLGTDFTVTTENYKHVGHKILLLKNYSAPISYGPMGHTLTVISRCAFREIRAFYGGVTSEEIQKIRSDSESALNRFKQEVTIVENFLESHGYGETEEYLQQELELIETCVTPGKGISCIESKAALILDELVPHFVEPRLNRLYLACLQLRVIGFDEVDIMKYAPNSIRMAYAAFHRHDNRNDSVQHALITLATLNWVPRKLPEELPSFHYQTTARIRDTVLRTLNKDELELFQHQHSCKDLEAFLVVTAILTLFCERSQKCEWY